MTHGNQLVNNSNVWWRAFAAEVLKDSKMILNWFDPQIGYVLLEMLLLLGLALVISSIGFYLFLYFLRFFMMVDNE